MCKMFSVDQQAVLKSSWRGGFLPLTAVHEIPLSPDISADSTYTLLSLHSILIQIEELYVRLHNEYLFKIVGHHKLKDI